MAAQRTAPQLVPLLSVAVAGRQAATHLLTRRRGSCNGSGWHAVATAFAGTSLRLAWRYGTTAMGKHPSVRRAGTAVERHLTRLPGTRQAEDLRMPPSLSQPVLELRQSFRCAPPGLVQALADVLGLPRQAELLALALGEDAEKVLTSMAKQRAEAIASGDRSIAVGPDRLLDATWALAGEAELAEKLSEIFSAYLMEILQIARVSVAFQEMSVPVADWRHAWADAVVTKKHVAELWAGSGQLGVGFTTLDAVSPELAMRARAELETMAAQGALSDFSQSTCNPGSQHLWLRFASPEERQDLQRRAPALLELGEALSGLPGALQRVAQAAGIHAPAMRLFPSLMAATYGPGSHYVPHQDKYSGGSAGFENTRMLTILCYLNPDWQPGDGGELRVLATRKEPSDQPGPGSRVPELLRISADHSESTASTACDSETFVDIPPLLGRIVMFQSREVWHGIQASKAARRWAVTLWLLAGSD
ncbi:phyA [Symbiodinium necroappetens]|uniref:PhyA protein n=1 Tax=Symbiodinium necroappetens TaxID=1628268 RepID=A0A812ZZC2_9DINO|nr:phyA [Symbiodinium necroappetens]